MINNYDIFHISSQNIECGYSPEPPHSLEPPRIGGSNEYQQSLLSSKNKENNVYICIKKVRENSGECHNHKPQPFPDTKRKRKQTKPNKRKSNKRTKSIKISSLFSKRGGNRNAKRTEKDKNKITQGKT